MPDGGVFDAEYYAENNPDVVAVFGTDKDALYSHYMNNGRAEGRLPFNDISQTGAESLNYVPYMSMTEVFGKTSEDVANMSGIEFIRYLDSAVIYGIEENVYDRYNSINKVNKTYKELYMDDLDSYDNNDCDDIFWYREKPSYMNSFEEYFRKQMQRAFTFIDCGGTYDGIIDTIEIAARNRIESLTIGCCYDGIIYSGIAKIIEGYKNELKEEFGATISECEIEKEPRYYAPGDPIPEPGPGYEVEVSLVYE